MDSLWIYLILIFFFIGKALIKSANKQSAQKVDDEEVKAAMRSRAFDQRVYDLLHGNNQTPSPAQTPTATMMQTNKKNSARSFMPERPVEAEPETYTPSIQTAYRNTPRPVVNDNNYAPTSEAIDFESAEMLRQAIVISEILNRKY